MRDRLIELIAEADKVCDNTKHCDKCVGYGKGMYCINHLVADHLLANGVIVQAHGEWIEQSDGWDGVLYTCSACRCDWCTIDGTPFENNMRFCPECGANMKYESEGADDDN